VLFPGGSESTFIDTWPCIYIYIYICLYMSLYLSCIFIYMYRYICICICIWLHMWNIDICVTCVDNLVGKCPSQAAAYRSWSPKNQLPQTKGACLLMKNHWQLGKWEQFATENGLIYPIKMVMFHSFLYVYRRAYIYNIYVSVP
jgi:hypothetical protein